MKTLRRKISLYFATVITIMIILLVILVANQIKNTNTPLTINLSEQIITAKSGQVGAWLSQRIAELKILAENETLISMDMKKIKPYMGKIDENHKEEFESFAIIDKKGHAWVTNDTYIDVSDRSYFHKMKDEDLEYVISDPIISHSNSEPIVVVIHVIRDERGQVVGYINGAIYVSKLSEIASEIKMYDGQGWICDREGNMFTKGQGSKNELFYIFDDEVDGYRGIKNIKGEMLEGTVGMDRFKDNKGRAIMVLYSPIPNAEGWFLGIHFSEKEMTNDTDQLLQMILIFGFSIILSLIIISIFLSSSIVRPIKELQNLMKKVEEGNLDIAYSYPGKDEIAQLGQSFNKMVVQISNLIKRVYIEQKNKREAELRTLQAQIQPHFLYNTLDTIHWMALEHQAYDIVRMVNALTHLFRISISRGEEIVPFEQEIKHVESYLFVQKVRYEDKLEYEILWDKELKQYKMLKLVLQPLVENAIYHGIKGKKGSGSIKIEGKIKDNEIEWKIIDNGIGIEEEKLRQITEVLDGRKKGEGVGYGMFNVDERLKLMFGNEYGIQIKSEYGKGTEVIFRHPLIAIEPKILEEKNFKNEG